MPAHSNNTNEQNKAADEAARTARTVTDEAARVGEQTARAGADVFRRSTETARDTLQAGLNTANQTFQRMTDQIKDPRRKRRGISDESQVAVLA